jgi:hypothetical protein
LITHPRFREPPELSELYDPPERRSLSHFRPSIVRTIWKAGRAFRTGALDAAAPYICYRKDESRPIALAQADEVAWRLRVVSRIVFGLQLCLFECVTTCAAMRRLGYETDIVIAHTTTPLPGVSKIHSWLALGSEVILEGEAAPYYFEVARYPQDLASPTPSPER